MSTHATLRARLEAELATLLRRHVKIESHLMNRDREVPQDWQEQATFRENDEVLEALDERTRARIGQLRTALAHMEEDDWGVCEDCGKTIPEGRMAILPATTLCVRCAERYER